MSTVQLNGASQYTHLGNPGVVVIRFDADMSRHGIELGSIDADSGVGGLGHRIPLRREKFNMNSLLPCKFNPAEEDGTNYGRMGLA
jgi:hypothetical protein